MSDTEYDEDDRRVGAAAVKGVAKAFAEAGDSKLTEMLLEIAKRIKAKG